MSAFVILLLDAAVRAAAVMSLAGLLLIVCRVRRAAVRLTAWRLVLWMLLVLPAAGRLLPPVSLHVPGTWPALSDSITPGRFTTPDRPGRPEGTPPPSKAASVPESAAVAAPPAPSSRSWRRFAVAIYIAGLASLLVRALVGWHFANRLEAAAAPITDPSTLARLGSHARRWRLSRPPNLLESGAAWVPMTLGVMRPAVVLPADWRRWSDMKLDIVLAHETAHVARHDALTHRLALLYRALFWFSPVSWWLHRHLVGVAEQASDEAVLEAGADPAGYAETLLEFFAAREPHAPRRAAWHVGMARRGSPDDRIQAVLNWQGGPDMKPARAAVIGLVLTMMPATALIAAVRPLPPAVQGAPPASVVSRPTPGEGHGPIPTSPSATTTTARAAGASRGLKGTEGRLQVDTRLYTTDGRSGNGTVEYQATPPGGARPADEVKSIALRKRLQGLFTQESEERPLFRSRGRSLPDPRTLPEERQEVICGLTVVRKSADIDPRIIIPPNRHVIAAARRIEPDVCRPGDATRK